MYEDFLCASLCSVLSPFIVSTLIPLLRKPAWLSHDRRLCGSHIGKSDAPPKEKRVAGLVQHFVMSPLPISKSTSYSNI